VQSLNVEKPEQCVAAGDGEREFPFVVFNNNQQELIATEL